MNLSVQIVYQKIRGKEVYEAYVYVPGLERAKVLRKDNTTTFLSRSTAIAAARRVAKKLNKDIDVLGYKKTKDGFEFKFSKDEKPIKRSGDIVTIPKKAIR